MENILTEYEQPVLSTQQASNLRIGAFFLDWLLLFITSIFYIRYFGEKTSSHTWHVGGIKAWLLFLAWGGYFTILEGSFGATLGKMVVGVRVVTLDGEKISYGQAIVRRIGDFLDIYCTCGLLGIILIKSSRNNQRLADRWARTIVVKN